MAKIRLEFKVPNGKYCYTSDFLVDAKQGCEYLATTKSFCLIFHTTLKTTDCFEVLKCSQCLNAEIKEK